MPSTTLDLRGFATRLANGGYTATALRERFGITYPDDIGILNHAPTLQRIARERSAAATLVRLFFLEVSEPEGRVAIVLSRATCAALLAGGLLARRAGTLRARLRIDAVGDQYYLADKRFADIDHGALRLPGDDPVYPPGSDSLMLRDAIVPGEAHAVLDLCTGSGVQALAHAAGAMRCVAVDVNPRAAALAGWNAQLNGIDNLDVRVGDLYAPVRGEQFDLIIANPPFVASPHARGPAYHAGGPSGDRVLGRIIAGLGAHLRPGGRAYAISHVALRGVGTMEAMAQRWFRDFPGRGAVVIVETGTPVDLAAAQSLFALARGTRAYAAEVRRWVDYLRRHRVHSIVAFLLVAERGSRRGIEVIDAQPRVLPIPLSPPPATRIAEWLK